MRRLTTPKLRSSLVACPLLLASSAAGAAGFALLEQSGRSVGSAFAGTAAAAEDPSTMYFNPAGMLHLEGTQAAAAISDADIRSRFSNANSAAALGQPLGNEGGDAGGMNWIPCAYLTARLNDRFAAGLGINAPFGLKLEYDQGWLGRFQALRSEIKTLNLNPAAAYRLNPIFTVAVGADYQRLEAELTSNVNYTAVIGNQAPAAVPANLGLQGFTSVKGEDWAWGFNAGVLIDLSDGARVGVHYRSPIRFGVHGDVAFSPPTATNPTGAAIIAAASAPGAPLSEGPVSVDLKVPGSATLSYWQRAGSRVEILADLAWTQWSSIRELRVVRSNGTTLSTTPELWDDTWRASLGAALTLNPRWKVRAGIAYDQTPVPDSTRTPRLPDGDRKWIGVGANWSPSPRMTIDLGYAHLFVEEVPVNQNAGNTLAYGLINGTQDTAIDIFSAQLTVKF